MPDLSRRPPDAAEGAFAGEVLRQPTFGTAPPPGTRYASTQARKYPFERHVEAARRRPNVTAKVATYTQGGRKETNRRLRNDHRKIREWLDSSCPLEKWQVITRTTPNTWFHRELWIRFDGYMTPAEAEAWRRERRAKAGRPPGTAARQRKQADQAANAQVVAMRSAERRYG